MRTIQPLFLVGLLTFAALSGCLAADDPSATSDSAAPTTSGTGTASPTTSAPAVVTDPVLPIANLTVNVTNGSLPLDVSFAVIDDSGADQENITWTLDFGDGNETNGTELPGRTNHTYALNGTFEVLLTLTTDAGESTDNETIMVEAGASTPLPPSQLVYESGPVVGCVTEGGYDNCPAYIEGPGNEEGLGIWIEIEPGHVGMSFITSETTGGDSDGWLFAEPDGAPLQDINNGGGEAGGVVPPEAKWILIVSWATPSENMVVTFSPAA